MSVTRNTNTSNPSVEYVPTGYTSKFTSSSVTFLHSPVRKSETNGSDGRNSRKNPKLHSINDILSHCSILNSQLLATKHKINRLARTSAQVLIIVSYQFLLLFSFCYLIPLPTNVLLPLLVTLLCLYHVFLMYRT